LPLAAPMNILGYRLLNVMSSGISIKDNSQER
jgi:hypothetical protein